MTVHLHQPLVTDEDSCLRLGLVNNMPLAAMAATERQFVSLLEKASHGLSIALSFYTIPGLPKATSGKQYLDTTALAQTRLDGLLVTGREPVKDDMREEDYWEGFTALLEWARENTLSTVWSCLAAHAAVLQMDGILREKRPRKHCGVFERAHVATHPLTAGLPQRTWAPHSRWNSLCEEELVASGYTVLLRTGEREVDTFIKMDGSLFVFSQGHPEYEADTLLREYRRDVGRFCQLQTDTYPTTPNDYFDPSTEGALGELKTKAEAGKTETLLTEVAVVLSHADISNRWAPAAVSFFRNWLQYLAEQKSAQTAMVVPYVAASNSRRVPLTAFTDRRS